MKNTILLFLVFSSGVAHGQTRTMKLDADCVKIQDGTCIDKTEFGYLDGTTSSIQTQLNSKGAAADVATLDTRLDSAESDIDTLQTADGSLDSRLDSVETDVADHESRITDIESGGVGVTGPVSSVDSEVAIFSGTGGNAIKRATGTGFAKLSSGVLSTSSTVNAASELTGTAPVANGGTGQSSLTSNNLLIGNGTSGVSFLAPGSAGRVVMSNGTSYSNSSTGLPLIPGFTRLKTCYAAFGGGSATLASPTICSSGSCVEVLDSCSAFSPPTRSGTGTYTDGTFANGTFANSTFLDCRCHAWSATSGQERDCTTYFITGDQTWSSNASGGYVSNIYTTNASGTASDNYVVIKCEGEAP